MRTTSAVLLLGILAAPAAAGAQGAPASSPAGPATAASSATGARFETGAIYAGPRLWIGNLNGATAIGAQAERGFTTAGQYGPGIIAGGVGIDYYSWSNDFAIGSYDYSVIPIQVFGNYHFPIEGQPKLDPYVGLAFVYSVVNASWDGPGVGDVDASASGSDIAGQAGLRYFINEKFAVQGQLGFGYGTLGIGATWKF